MDNKDFLITYKYICMAPVQWQYKWEQKNPDTVSGNRIIRSGNRIGHSGNSGNRIGHGLSQAVASSSSSADARLEPPIKCLSFCRYNLCSTFISATPKVVVFLFNCASLYRWLGRPTGWWLNGQEALEFTTGSIKSTDTWKSLRCMKRERSWYNAFH